MGTKFSKEAEKNAKQETVKTNTTKAISTKVNGAVEVAKQSDDVSTKTTDSEKNLFNGNANIGNEVLIDKNEKLTPGNDYAHFNSKLNIDDFDLLKVH